MRDLECRVCGAQWREEKRSGRIPRMCTPCKDAARRRRAEAPSSRARARAYGEKYRATNRELLREKQRLAYAANPERHRGHSLKIRYGLSLDQYKALLDAQAGGCALCTATECQTGRALPVDHDHTTGVVRGILCHSCNSTLLPGYERLPAERRDSERLNAYLARGILERDPYLDSVSV